jgi:hypothetical protein
LSARDSGHHPFHPPHLISAMWALVGGLIVLVATEWYHSRQGPQQVIVTNQDTTRRVIYVGDTMSRVYLPQVLKELQRLRRATATAPAGAPMVGPDTTPSSNAILLDGFKLPPVVKGATVDDFGKWGRGTCPASQVAPGGDLVFTATLRSAADTARLTPLSVSITRPQGPNAVYQVSAVWFALHHRNRVVLPAPMEPGNYTLEYGVYVRDRVNMEYPPIYQRACRFTVTPQPH